MAQTGETEMQYGTGKRGSAPGQERWERLLNAAGTKHSAWSRAVGSPGPSMCMSIHQGINFRSHITHLLNKATLCVVHGVLSSWSSAYLAPDGLSRTGSLWAANLQLGLEQGSSLPQTISV